MESFQDSGDDGKIGSDSHACLGPYSTQKQYFCKLKQYNNAIHQSVFLHKYIPEHNSRYSYRSLQFNIMCCRISTDIRRWQRARVYVLYGDWCTCGMYWWGRLVLPACPHIITRTFQEGLKRKGVGLDVGRWELW